MNETEKQAAALFDRVHRSSEWQALLQSFCDHFSSSAVQVRRAFIDYMSNSGDHGNEMYSPSDIRYAMIVESEQNDSWHFDRRAFIQHCLDHPMMPNSPAIVHDYGFGIIRPEYIDRGRKGSHHFTLSDAYESAIEVGEFMLVQAQTSAELSNIKFVLDALENAPSDSHPPDLVLLLDSIEHTPNPTKAMQSIVRSSKSETLFGLILPVGPLIASHHLSWDSTNATREWLNDLGLEIVEERIIRPDGAFDIFAESTLGTFAHAALCRNI